MPQREVDGPFEFGVAWAGLRARLVAVERQQQRFLYQTRGDVVLESRHAMYIRVCTSDV